MSNLNKACEPLRIVKPESIQDSQMVYSNVPENDYPEYDPNKTYNLGDRVIDKASHKVWESFADDNKGNAPWANPEKWGSPGLTNRWRCLDDKISSRTMHPDEIVYRFKIGRAVTNIVLMNVVGAESVTVKVTDPNAGVVFEETQKMRPVPSKAGWWGWFFSHRVGRTQTMFEEMPTYPKAEIEVKLEGGEGLGVGLLLLGTVRTFGKGIHYGARAGLLSYSKVVKDTLTGEVELLKRPTARRSSLNVTVKNQDIDDFYRFMVEIESTPIFMAGWGHVETLSGYGVIKNFEVTFSNYSETDCSVEFEGFI